MKHIGKALLFFALVGCVSYQARVRQARADLANGQAAAAATFFAEKASQEGNDQLLYLLDYGIALHQAGDLEKSNKILLEADHLAELKDYTSLSREAGSLFTSEALIQYKSERFENILINVYMALNYTLLGDYENALVECRRIDTKIYKQKLENEDERKSFFARYLSAMIWEEQGKWSEAYIDYNNAYKINPNVNYLRKDLIRMAWRAGRSQTLRQWLHEFPHYELKDIKNEMASTGELVFIYQQGWIPRKYPRPENFRFPYLVPQNAAYSQAVVEVDGEKQKPTENLYNVGAEAIRTLDNDFNYLVAKKIIGIVAKQVVADQIRQKNKGLGALALIAMNAADQADLRQWSTLPDSFQMTKVSLPPGSHHVKIWAQGSAGEKLIYDATVTIKKGKKTFISRRTF